jgi:hypothetical protein
MWTLKNEHKSVKVDDNNDSNYSVLTEPKTMTCVEVEMGLIPIMTTIAVFDVHSHMNKKE